MRNYLRSTVAMMAMLLICISITNVVFARHNDDDGDSGRHGRIARDASIERKLGGALFEDINLSLNRNQSCKNCHGLSRVEVPTEVKPGIFKMRKQAAKAFVDPTNIMNGTGVSDGSVDRDFGGLNSPSIGYAAFSPVFHWDKGEELFLGGQFWNGRAADLKEQAQGPFINPVEMAMPDEFSVIERLRENPKYVRIFKRLYDINLTSIQEANYADVLEAYKAMADAIATFERTKRFNKFNSKFDYEAAGMTAYNASEQRGADLFDGIALCGEYHTTEGVDGDDTPALLTDFSYDNLGTPPNPQIPGQPAFDPGLLGNPNLDAVRGAPTDPSEVEGRHKVMSLRNIALTAPYMHNGIFKTLEEVVHFYNTRDTLGNTPTNGGPADATNPEFGTEFWPEGEFHGTRNIDELGNLGLTPQEEADVVAYLKTFTDNYPSWGNKNGLSDPNVPQDTPSPFRDFPLPVHSVD